MTSWHISNLTTVSALPGPIASLGTDTGPQPGLARAITENPSLASPTAQTWPRGACSLRPIVSTGGILPQDFPLFMCEKVPPEILPLLQMVPRQRRTVQG